MSKHKLGKIKCSFYNVLADYLQMLGEEKGYDEEEIDEERQQHMEAVDLLEDMYEADTVRKQEEEIEQLKEFKRNVLSEIGEYGLCSATYLEGIYDKDIQDILVEVE